MTSRLQLTLLLALLTSLSTSAVPSTTVYPEVNTITSLPSTTVTPIPVLNDTFPLPQRNFSYFHSQLSIDFARSHYDFDNCGKPNSGRSRRGFGDDSVDGLDFDFVGDAKDAEVGETPWAVAIVTRVVNERSPRLCAGTLVSRRHVLSAAHCLSSTSDIPVHYGHVRCKTTSHLDLHDFMEWSEVKYGGECLRGADSSCQGITIAKSAKIKKITMFPFFREDCSRGSDLVILELDQDVDVPHACLSHLHDMEDATLRNTTLTPFHTFGWTADKSNGFDSADRLRMRSLFLKQDRCARKWRHLSPDVLCFAEDKHISHCLGESGSGLMIYSHHRAFIIGVLSSTSSCAPESHKQKGQGVSRFTDIRLFSSNIDRALGTVGPLPDFS